MPVLPGKEKKFDETKKMLRSVLLAEKDGILHYKLQHSYQDAVFEPIPFRDLGFHNLEAMLSAMPDTVRVAMDRDGEKVYKGIADESTAHIQKMVSAQKSVKKKPKSKRGAPYKALQSKRPSYQRKTPGYKAPWGKTTGSPFGPPRGNQSAPQRFPTSNRGGRGGYVGGRPMPGPPRNPAPYSTQAYVPARSWNPENDWGDRRVMRTGFNAPTNNRNGNGDYQNIQVKIPNRPDPAPSAEVVKFGDRFNVPPRFQQLQREGKLLEPERTNRHVEVGGRPSAAQQRQPPNSRFAPQSSQDRRVGQDSFTSPKSRSSKENYKPALRLYLSSQGLPSTLQFQSIEAKSGGYLSSIVIKGQSFGSLDVFPTKHEAEQEAAKNACESLGVGQTLSCSTSPARSYSGAASSQPPAQCTPEIKNRVKEILASRQSGLWLKRLPIEYKERYNIQPPKELMAWVQEMDDVATVQRIENSDRIILFPLKNIRLTQTGRAELVEIKSAVMPKVKSRVEVGVTFLTDPQCLYVQCSNAADIIENITTQLQDIYESRGAPKQLVNGDVGDYCVAKYEVDEFWYRGLIQNKSSDTYTVFYVDFGNTEVVATGQVRRILETMCRDPAQSIQCSLHNVHPLQRNWPKSIEEEMNRLMNVPLVMDVIEVEGDCCSVELFFESDMEHSFNENLVNKGLASSYPLPPEPDTITLPDTSEWEVSVTYIRSTTEVKIRLVGEQYSDRLERLEEQLVKTCVTRLPRKCIQDSVCVARQQDDSGVVRADRVRILSVNSNEADVYYVDYGERCTIDVSRLYMLPAHLNTLPYQAIPVKLSGLEPFEHDKAVVDKLVDLCMGYQGLIAEVEEKLETVSITLWDTSTDLDININSKVAEVLNTSQLKPTLPPAGSRVEGYVTTIGPDGHIYLLLQGPGLDKLNELLEEMTRIYGVQDDALLFVSQPQEGQLVAAMYEDDSGTRSWYRGLVQEILPGRKVRVFYVDYGDVVVLPFTGLRFPAKEAKYMERLPHQVLKVQLYNFPPPGKELKEAAMDRLAELLLPDDQQVTVHIEVFESSSGPEGGDSGQLPVVELFLEVEDGETGAEEEKNVLAILEEEGLLDSEDDEAPEWVVLSEVEGSLLLDEDSQLVTEEATEDAEDTRVVAEDVREIAEDVTEVTREVAENVKEVAEDVRLVEEDSQVVTEDSQLVRDDLEVVGEDSQVEELEVSSQFSTPSENTSQLDHSQDASVSHADVSMHSAHATTGQQYAPNPVVHSAVPSASPYSAVPFPSPYSASPYSAVPSASPYSAVPFSSPYSAVPSASPYSAVPSASPYSAVPSASPYSVVPSASPFSAVPSAFPYSVAPPPSLSPYPLDTSLQTYSNGTTSNSSNIYAGSSANPIETVTSTETIVDHREEPTGFVPSQLQDVTSHMDRVTLRDSDSPRIPDIATSGQEGYVEVSSEQPLADVDIAGLILYDQEHLNELPPQPAPSSGDQVYVTWAEHPFNFRVIPEETIGKLQTVMQNMQELYAQYSEELRVLEPQQSGIYAGEFNGTWYRLKVRNVLPMQVSVRFVDYGDCSILAKSDLCHLIPQFRELPPQAVCAKLSGVLPVQGEWSAECSQRLQELILEKVVTMWKHGDEDGEGFYSMTLIDTNRDASCFIHRVLVEEGYAVNHRSNDA